MNLFGCRHRRQTFPITPKKPIDRVYFQPAGRTYTVCLDCGEELDYDVRPLYSDRPEEHKDATPAIA